jgi:hypothetical protein
MLLSAEGSSSINIARRVMKGMGWGRGEPYPEPADEAKGVKPQLNAGSLVLHGEVAHFSRKAG